jgi:hypothetical protein
MTKFRPTIQIITNHIRGYGAPDFYTCKGVYDNRRLFDLRGCSLADVSVRGERARVKWEKCWPSKDAFVAIIERKPPDTAICSNCGQPGANSSCLDKMWCERPACRQALEKARVKHAEDQDARETYFAAKKEQDRRDRVAECDRATTGFHWREGWFFKRLPDGSVRVVNRENPASEWLMVDITIDLLSWSSIVCSVSAEGETAERWDAAQEFHGRPNTTDSISEG